ncbi:MAG TPA: Ig-like domain-containing protein [Gemmatimonadales bacterium]|nr:Ig-like domain-containing protein [Gemmatimonadales bacterium]
MKKAAASSNGVLGSAGKWFTALITTCAAVAGLLVNAQSLGLTSWLGSVDLGIAAHAARRIVVAPRADTLLAIGDTAVLSVTVTDRRGAVLMGALVDWKSDDTNVVVVDTTGAAVARGPGSAQVTAMLRDLRATARILVTQKPERLVLTTDTAVRVLEGDTVRLRAHALDARGHTVRGRGLRWQSADTAVAQVDSAGLVTARGPGRVLLRGGVGGLDTSVAVQVDLAPATLGILSGAGQRGPAGRPQAEPIVLLVLSRGGLPVPNTGVALAAETGTVDPASGTTDRTGRFRANWTLGPRPGPQRLKARVLSLDSTVTITAEADPVPGNTRVELAGPPPVGDVGHTIEEPLVIRVTDSTGAALPDVPVRLSVLDRGSIAAQAERTDSLGQVTARWTLGPKSGPQRVRVEVGNPRTLPAFTVSGTGLPGPARALVVRAGALTGTAGRALAQPVMVTAVDAGGNAVLEGSVSVRAHHGHVADTVVRFDTQGRALIPWTLGDTAGPQTLEVRMAGVDSAALVHATATAGPAARLVLKGETGKPGTPVVATAEVTDGYGNPVAKTALSFSASGGKVATAKVTTDKAGKATTKWTPAPGSRPQTLTVRVPGTRLSASWSPAPAATASPPVKKPVVTASRKKQ